MGKEQCIIINTLLTCFSYQFGDKEGKIYHDMESILARRGEYMPAKISNFNWGTTKTKHRISY